MNNPKVLTNVPNSFSCSHCVDIIKVMVKDENAQPMCLENVKPGAEGKTFRIESNGLVNIQDWVDQETKSLLQNI